MANAIDRQKMIETLPASVSKYILDIRGTLDDIIAHRIVNGEETKYAVLMRHGTEMWTIVFVGLYRARRPLGDYEEATRSNAVLVEWDCLYDAGEWEHSEGKFRSAPYACF